MDELRVESTDIVKKNVDAILSLFPDCRTEFLKDDGSISYGVDVDKLRVHLGDLATDIQEKYEFNWVGKRVAFADALTPTRKSLRLRLDESRNWENTANVFIEGDNLDVLKILRKSYLGKVDLIYIDPPYNTGNDSFVYKDKFLRAKSKNERIVEQNETGGLLFYKNLKSSARFHSDWCSMFYSRIMLARELLSESGAVFVSIDDKEQANAVKILDEVFGRNNFVATIVWETKHEAKGIPPRTMCVKNHEYILCYSKTDKFKFIGAPRRVEDGFSNPDNDPRGPWKRQYLQRFGQGFPVRTIVDPTSGHAFSFETPYTKEKLEQWVQDGRISFPDDYDKFPVRKEYFNEYANPNKPIVTSWGLYSTKIGSEELKKLFNGRKVFDYSKPIELMTTLLRNSLSPTGLVVDLFAGSGATAHAVMRLNAEDGGTRRYVLIQAPELCNEKSDAYRYGFHKISEICLERIKLVSEQLASSGADVGFRSFYVDAPNRNDSLSFQTTTSEDATGSVGETKTEQTELTTLFSVVLELGLLPDRPCVVETIDGDNIYNYDSRRLVACFAGKVSENTLIQTANFEPEYALFNESSFPTSAERSKVYSIFAKRSPRTNIVLL